MNATHERRWNGHQFRKLLGLGAAVGLATQAYGQWTEQVLTSFVGYTASGNAPEGPLIQGKDGALYGLTSDGGISFGMGTAFKINCDGSGFTVLHTFHVDQAGRNPQGGFVQTADGTLYSMTANGGSNSVGTLFKMSADGRYFATVHDFGADTNDGMYPVSGVLIRGTNGALYGTTAHSGLYNKGTVFSINPDGGNYKILHSFAANDGYGLAPDCGVIQASNGVLYGTTPQSGTNGGGTVYKLAPDGTDYAIIHMFGGTGEGRLPYCALVQGDDGALYGTTSAGGPRYDGVVFKLNLDGTGYQLLYAFNEAGSDLHAPQAGLLKGGGGFLYGTCYSGGTGVGGVFRIKTDGTSYAVLRAFISNNADASSPAAALILGRDGCLYGTSLFGGPSYGGTVFRLTPPAPPQLYFPRVLSDGRFVFSLTAPAGQSCHIDASTNLVDWSTFTNVITGTNAVEVIDPSATNSLRRFYRAGY